MLRAARVPPPPALRPMLLRYLLRELTGPALFACALLALIALTQDLLGWTDLVIRRGLGAGAVAWIAALETLPQLARTLPFGVLLGSLMGLGRLGADHELLALEACGVSARQLVRPVVVLAAAMTGLGLLLSLVGAPASVRALERSLEQLARERPGASVQAGRVERFGHWKLEAREVSEGGAQLGHVLLWIPEIGETVFAEGGSLAPVGDGGTELVLRDGALLLRRGGAPAALRFDRIAARLPGTGGPIAPDEIDPLSAAGLGELRALARSGQAGDHEALLARIELQRRFALPLATLLLGALAVPLLLAFGWLSVSGGAVLGILAALGHYGLTQLGGGLVQAGWLGVAAGVWLPDVVLAALGLVLIRRLPRLSGYGHAAGPPGLTPGGGPVSRAAPEPREARRRILDRYVAASFTRIALLSFATLLAGYLLIDVLEHLQFFARYAATTTEVVRYYVARLPVLASRIVPMALLFGSALTVGLFAARGELLGMRSCGVPAPRAMLAVLALSAAIVPADFLLNDQVVPRAMAFWHTVKNVEIRQLGIQPRPREPVWYRIGSHLYEAAELDPELGTARDVVLYDLDSRGLPTSRTDAGEARYIGRGVWHLLHPSRFEVRDGALAPVPAPSFAALGEEVPAEVDTREISLAELAREIRVVEESGYDATFYRVDLYAKLAAPVACLVLPALALFFAVGGAAPPGPASTLLFGMVTAVGFVLLTGVAESLGYAGRVPPPVAGLGPVAVMGALALALAGRVRGPWRAP